MSTKHKHTRWLQGGHAQNKMKFRVLGTSPVKYTILHSKIFTQKLKQEVPDFSCTVPPPSYATSTDSNYAVNQKKAIGNYFDILKNNTGKKATCLSSKLIIKKLQR